VQRDLDIQPVFEDTFSLVLPENHQLTQRKFKSLNQVKAEPFILFEKEYSSSYFDIVMSIFDDAGFAPIISHTTVHANTIFRLVENNFGISIVPSSLALGYDLKVKFIELKDIEHRTELSVVWNKRNKNPVMHKVLDLILKKTK
jgi:DNA-binding transcriptional LysR family regulator